MRAILLLLLLASLAGSSAGPPRPPTEYHLFFPTVKLQPDEQIEKFEVSVACGHVVSVINIPSDWNVSVSRAVSSVEQIHASAGHGISYLRQLRPFDGTFRIRPTDRSCFEVTATVVVVFDEERRIHLSQPQLRLVP